MNRDARAAGPEWRTALSEIRDDVPFLHGYDLSEAAAEGVDFPAIVLLAATGELPSRGQAAMMNAILVLTAAHGISPSGAIARILASCGVPLQVAVAGSTLSTGDNHGGSGEQLSRALYEAVAEHGAEPEKAAADVVERCLTQYGFVPGYGHPMHTAGDPRAPLLLDLARRHGVAGTYVAVAEAGEVDLARRRGRPIPLNATGAIAAVLNDLGVPWQFGRALISAARSATVGALALEEVRRERRWRMVASGPDVAYDGVPPRPLPEEWRT
jgi:citrate synthase